MPALTVALLALATYRATRLLVKDTFPPIAAMREWVVERYGSGSSLGYLIECPWCVSVWLGGAAVLIACSSGVHVPLPWATWPVCSGITGLIAMAEPD